MATWERYFHFPVGTRYEIDGPFGYDGTGQVLERTDDTLKIRLELPKWGPAPAFSGTILVIYRQEGPGNTVALERDGGELRRDDEATVRSVDKRRERAITSNDITCSMRYDGKDEIDFDVFMEGKSYDFDLKR
jgi:hypothetical protein